MKSRFLFAVMLCLIFTGIIAKGQVPQLINYQGRVAVGGTNFDGTGQFKFALVSGGAPVVTYWSNDGTSTAGGEPAKAVSLAVGKGLYSVLLGDATLPNMTIVPATVFTNPDVRLRVWFDDGTAHGSQQLTPDQRIAAVGYAMMAGSVPDGSITAGKLAPGAVGASQLAPGVLPAAQSVTGPTQAAAPNTSYVVTGATPTAFTLPASANVGDTIQITGASAGWTATLANAWVARDSVRNWWRVASSKDGTKLVACVGGPGGPGQIYTSTDSGSTWTPRADNKNWWSVASSDGGTNLVA